MPNQPAAGGDRPAPPDRDPPRQYLVIGLIFGGLVLAGILIGVYDDRGEAPVAVSPLAATGAAASAATPGSR